MPANTSPIFTNVPNVGVAIIGASANTKSDGAGTVGTDMMKCFTAGSNGSYVSRIRYSPYASVAATATAATVFRLYYSTVGSGATTSADTHLIQEVALGAQTADQTTVATFYIEVQLGFAMPSSSFLHTSSHIVNNANTGWQAVCFGGDY